jgi:hypothetical protein
MKSVGEELRRWPFLTGEGQGGERQEARKNLSSKRVTRKPKRNSAKRIEHRAKN